MSVTDQVPRKVGVAAPGATVFPYDFKVISKFDMLVQVDGVTKQVDVDYTLSGVGLDAGGDVTFLVPLVGGETVVRLRSMAYARDNDFQQLGDLRSPTLNNDQDAPVMMIQQLADAVSRAIKLPNSSTGSGDITGIQPLAPLVISADGQGVEAGSTTLTGDMLLRPNLASGAVDAGSSLITFRRQDGTTAPLSSIVRDRLAAARTYYVRADGNDANTGLSNTAGGAFLTIQRAIDVALGVDSNGKNVSISVGNGSYQGFSVPAPIPGGGTLYIVGNTTTPANVVLTKAGADCILANGAAQILVAGFKVGTTGASGNGISAINSAVVTVGAMDFGACINSHVNVGAGGTIAMTANYSITGGGDSHLHAGSPGLITFGPVTATLTGTPAFTAYFAGVAQGSIIATQATFSGSATGLRYLAHNFGVIMGHPGFSNPFPGSVAGYADAGGIYKAGVAAGVQYASERDSGAFITFQSWNGSTQLYRTHITIQTDPSGTGRGYCYFNGDDSYSSGRTHLGTDTRVQANVGTTRGTTFNASGNAIDCAADGTDCAWWARRTSDGTIHQFLRGTTFVGSISVTASATAFNTSSDRRLKDIAGPAPYDPEWIKRIAAVVVEYSWKADPEKTPVTGPVAQELMLVHPEAVTPGDDAPDKVPGDKGYRPWGVDASKVIWKLLQEVAELRARMDAQPPQT